MKFEIVGPYSEVCGVVGTLDVLLTVACLYYAVWCIDPSADRRAWGTGAAGAGPGKVLTD